MDRAIKYLLDKEYKRQQEWLEMIASENYVSQEVMNAYSNIFTNKYSEWYPWRRYYWWQEYVDRLELLTQFRALAVFDLIDYEKYLNYEKVILDENRTIWELVELYNQVTTKISWSVNVQPLSGTPANLSVYIGLLESGDTILGMDLSAGWHLSHWYKITASWKCFNAISYWVKKDNYLIDYDEILDKALKYKPKLIIAWYSAHTKDLNYKRFWEIANELEKKYWYRPYLMADIAHIAWLIAGGVLSNDLWKYFDVVTTTTHKTLRWPRWALVYCKKNIESKINRGVFPGIQWWPHEHVIFAKSVAFWEILKNEKKDRKEYIQQVVKNAKVLAREFIQKWRNVITWWTENHIVLVNVADSFDNLNLDWKIAEQVLEKVWISINKNAIPYDKRPPLKPSWIRLWTPAITTRWFKENDIIFLSGIIDKALKNWKNDDVLFDLKKEILKLCNKYPLKYKF